MKLSDIKGDRVLDVIADVIEPAGRIASDPSFKKLTKRQRVPKGKTANEFFLERVKENLPAIIRDNKADIVEMLAIINGVTPEKYGENMTLSSLLKDVYDILTDEEFLGFLTSSASETEDSSAGDA